MTTTAATVTPMATYAPIRPPTLPFFRVKITPRTDNSAGMNANNAMSGTLISEAVPTDASSMNTAAAITANTTIFDSFLRFFGWASFTGGTVEI